MEPSYPVVHFDGREFQLAILHYVDAPHLCLRLTDDRGELAGLWASAVFAPDAELAANEVLVHDHSDTSGMLQALETAGIARATGRFGDWCGLLLPVAELAVDPPRDLRESVERVREVEHNHGGHER